MVACLGGAQVDSDRSALSVLNRAKADGLDIGRAVDTIRHRFTTQPRGLVSEDSRYRLELTRKQLVVSPRALRSRAASGSRRPQGPHGRQRQSPREFDRAAATRIELASVQTEQRRIDPRARRWSPRVNRAGRLVARGIREHVRAGTGHIDWGFELGRSLRGAGSLTLSAHVVAPGQGVQAGGALRWDDGRGRTLEVGRLRVMTSHERTLPALLKKRNGGFAIIVQQTGTASSDYPLSVDVQVSPEYPASDITYGRTFNAFDPKVAWNGSEYLVAWDEQRLADDDIFATRLSADGHVLDPAGLVVDMESEDQDLPQ